MASNLFYFWSGDVRVILFDCILGHLHVVALTLVVLGETVRVAVIAVTALAVVTEPAYFFFTSRTLRFVGLLDGCKRREVWDFERRCLFDHFFLIEMLSKFQRGYL